MWRMPRRLFSHGLRLHKVRDCQAPKHTIGTTTVEALQSGIVFGFAGVVEAIVARIKKELGENVKVVATSDDAEIIAEQTKIIDVINPDLVLIGLRLIYEINRS